MKTVHFHIRKLKPKKVLLKGAVPGIRQNYEVFTVIKTGGKPAKKLVEFLDSLLMPVPIKDRQRA